MQSHEIQYIHGVLQELLQSTEFRSDVLRERESTHRFHDKERRLIDRRKARGNGEHLHELHEQVKRRCLNTFPKCTVFSSRSDEEFQSPDINRITRTYKPEYL